MEMETIYHFHFHNTIKNAWKPGMVARTRVHAHKHTHTHTHTHTLRRQKQEDYDFETSLGYTVRIYLKKPKAWAGRMAQVVEYLLK
jgi:hypothetical protein